MNDLAMFLADKQHYDNAGGSVGGFLVVCVILWLLFGGSGSKK